MCTSYNDSSIVEKTTTRANALKGDQPSAIGPPAFHLIIYIIKKKITSSYDNKCTNQYHPETFVLPFSQAHIIKYIFFTKYAPKEDVIL